VTFLPFLHFFVLITYVYLGFNVLVNNPKSRINWSCFISILGLMIWSLSMIFIQSPYTPEAEAILANKLGAVGRFSFYSFFVWFSLEFTGNRKLLNEKKLIFILGALPLLFILKQWSSLPMVRLLRAPYGWGFVWQRDPVTYIYFIFSLFAMIGAVYVMYRGGRRILDPVKKKNTLLMCFLVLFGFLPGYFINVGFPLLKIYDFPPIANVFPIFWAIGLVYSTTKHKFLAITTSTAAENIISAMADSLILLDPEGNIIASNKATTVLLGYSEQELVGKNLTMLIPASSGDPVDARALDFILGLENIGEFVHKERACLAKDGSLIPMLFSVSTIRDYLGDIQGIVVIAKDITEIKKSKDKLMRLNEELVEKGKKLLKTLGALELTNAELKASQEKLVRSEKLASLGRFVAEIAHEINNPLMIVSGRAQLIQMEEVNNENISKSLRIIIDQCERAKRIIYRLLIFSEPSRSEVAENSINDVIESVIQLMENQYALSNIGFQKKYGQNMPRVNIDEKQMREVIMSLLKNASEAMPEGGVIEIETLVDRDNLRINISDSGVGIAKEHLGKIFDPFYSTKGGMGLGLSVCYGIIKAHRGDLLYSSKPGQGTIASIILPLNMTSLPGKPGQGQMAE